MANDKKIEEAVEGTVENTIEKVEGEVEEVTKTTPSTIRQAEALIQLKKKVDADLLQMQGLKNEIKPAATEGPIRTPSGTVSFVSGSITKSLDKNLVRQQLMEQLRISSESANKIIESGSMDKVIASYVKVTPE